MRRWFNTGQWRGLLSVLALLALAAPMCGCGTRNEGAAEDDELLIVPVAEAALPRAVEQEGFEMAAMGQGSMVRLFLRNIRRRDILVGPKCFGVIAPGAKVVEPFQLGRDDHFLPVRVLKEGEGVQGFLRFNTLDNVVGGRLVFVPPDENLSPIQCPIQADPGPAPAGEESR